MWRYFPRGPLENRVLKTRFIIQKNFKNFPSPKHGFTSPDRIRSERESDQREGDQIRERQIVRSERERKRSRGSRDLGSRDLGSRNPNRAPGLRTWVAWPRPREPRLRTWVARRATQVARPGSGDLGSRDPGARSGSRNPGARLLLLCFFFFFFSFWLWFLFWLVLFWYIWALNWVFKTRFSSGQHVENDATSDVIRPWKSSLKDSIYCSKSSLLDSNC